MLSRIAQLAGISSAEHEGGVRGETKVAVIYDGGGANRSRERRVFCFSRKAHAAARLAATDFPIAWPMIKATYVHNPDARL